MQILMKVVLTILVIVALLIVTAPAEAKQGGVLVPETYNARMDTYKTHRRVFKNFTYELDAVGADTWQVYDGAFKFVGDCEDFAFTMQHAIGAGSAYAAYLPEEGVKKGDKIQPNHVVFVYAGMVWELNGKAYNIQRYEQDGRRIFFRLGDVTPELK